MEIWVEFNGKDWRTTPDPAVVKRGELVSWRFQANGVHNRPIRWLIYFDKRSPFGRQGNRLSTTTVPRSDQHVGMTEAKAADEPGEYKYGVRAEDLQEEVTLGDDDPRLIVMP